MTLLHSRILPAYFPLQQPPLGLTRLFCRKNQITHTLMTPCVKFHDTCLHIWNHEAFRFGIVIFIVHLIGAKDRLGHDLASETQYRPWVKCFHLQLWAFILIKG